MGGNASENVTKRIAVVPLTAAMRLAAKTNFVRRLLFNSAALCHLLSLDRRNSGRYVCTLCPCVHESTFLDRLLPILFARPTSHKIRRHALHIFALTLARCVRKSVFTIGLNRKHLIRFIGPPVNKLCITKI